MNALYILFARDNYPDIMLPAISLICYFPQLISLLDESSYYLFYFIPFMVINTLLFVPIPIAVIFDAFRVLPDYDIELFQLNDSHREQSWS